MIIAVFVASLTVQGYAQVVSTAPLSPSKETVVSSVTKLPVDVMPAREDISEAYDQPLMATGVDLAGKPRRFPAHQTPGHSGIVDY